MKTKNVECVKMVQLLNTAFFRNSDFLNSALTYRIKTTFLHFSMFIELRWSRGHKARGQGQGHKKNPRPRPRTAFPRTDTLEAKDRNARGQGPRTQAQVLSKKKKKKVFTKIL